jgi:aspartate kinase
MKVMKFGGIILRDLDGFRALLNVLDRYNEEKVVLVISAFSTATRDLRKAALTAEKGHEEKAYTLLDKIIRIHLNFALSLIKNKISSEKVSESVKIIQHKIKQLLRGIFVTQEVTPRTMDLVMSYGELLALRIVDSYLDDNNYQHIAVDSTILIVSDSNYGKANPDIEKTKAKLESKLLPLFDKNNLIITQGFVARDTNGEITTMGIESSNLSALIFAKLLGNDELTIWTDVEGIRTADPKLAAHTSVIPNLSFEEAEIAAKSGLKLIIPSMLEYIENNDFRIFYRSAFSPDGEFSIICSLYSNSGKSLIIYKSNLYCTVYNSGNKILPVASGLFTKIIDDSLKTLLISEEPIKITDNENIINYYDNITSIIVINCSINQASIIVSDISDINNGNELIHYCYNISDLTLSLLIKSNNIKMNLKRIHDLLT